jgi:hypothetical protein
MAHAGAWPSIERLGLLSTPALLDLFEINGERRDQLEARRRARSEEITHDIHRRALLRDQKPLNEKKLANALLDGLKPRDWYGILNRKVFFGVRRVDWEHCGEPAHTVGTDEQYLLSIPPNSWHVTKNESCSAI